MRVNRVGFSTCSHLGQYVYASGSYEVSLDISNQTLLTNLFLIDALNEQSQRLCLASLIAKIKVSRTPRSQKERMVAHA